MNREILEEPSVVKLIAQRYKHGYSPIILICGKMRVGKTTKAFLFANWLSWKIFNKKWDWRENTILSIDQLVQKLNHTKSEEIFVMDEVQRQLNKKNWSDPSSRLFSLIMTSQARKHFILFLLLPHAWDLGSDHASNVNYVIPIHTRKLCYPYRIESNDWDISLKKKIPKKFPLGHFNLNYKAERISLAFEEELLELDDFKKLIDVNLKDNIMEDAVEQTLGFLCRKCGSKHKKGECPL